MQLRERERERKKFSNSNVLLLVNILNADTSLCVGTSSFGGLLTNNYPNNLRKETRECFVPFSVLLFIKRS